MKNIVFLFSTILLLISCNSNKEIKFIEKDVFNTVIKVGYFDKNYDKKINDSLYILDDINKKYNSFVDNSQVDNINKNAGSYVKIDEELKNIINKTIEVSKKTNGLYDITISPLLRVWGFMNYNETPTKIPSKEDLEKAKKLVDYKNIVIDKDGIKINKDQEIVTGSFLKGYAIDEFADNLIGKGLKNFYISSISSIRAIGEKPDGSSWRFGIVNPENINETLHVVNLKNKALGVSGDYQTLVEIEGKTFHHIINPETMYPSTNKMVVIVSDSAFEADIYSTALFNLEPKKAIEILNNMDNIEGFIVDKDMNITYSNNIKDYLD